MLKLVRVVQILPHAFFFIYNFQQTLLSIAGSLIIPLLVADSVCAKDDNQLMTTLLSTTMLMNGLTSFMQTVVGIR